MIHLHLTREAFQKVKDGLKRSEFRPDNDYYNNHVWKIFEKYYPKYKGVVMQIDFEVI